MEIDKTGGGGGVTARTFEYDDAGNRVGQTAGTGEEAVTTTYLIDENNLTGYSQTLEQTDRDYSEAVVKKTTYVVGADVTGQYVTEDSTTTGAIYLQDAHGSTRGLYATTSAALLDAALVTAGGSTWTKTLTYDAYGNAGGFDPATALTEMLYNGESFNATTGQQYLRARWYDSASGRFGAMDPWAGDIKFPNTLHRYLYCKPQTPHPPAEPPAGPRRSCKIKFPISEDIPRLFPRVPDNRRIRRAVGHRVAEQRRGCVRDVEGPFGRPGETGGMERFAGRCQVDGAVQTENHQQGRREGEFNRKLSFHLHSVLMGQSTCRGWI